MAASWGADLTLYLEEKRHVPQAPSIERFTRKSAATVATHRARRDFDILSNTIPNEEKRKQFEAEVAQQTETHVKRGIAKEMSAANHGYNILSMQPRFGMSADAISQMGGNMEARGKRIFEKRTKYDVVSMRPLYEDVLEEERAAAERIKNKAFLFGTKPRERNILSHRYATDHESRVAAEEQERRRKLDIVSAAASSYNPVSCKFRRTDVEEAAVAEKNEQEAHQRQIVAGHTYKVSHLVGRSEGHAYDIVAGTLYNPEYVLKVQQQAAKGVPQRARLHQGWEHQRDVDESVREYDAQRAVNRISTERVKETLRRGHDLLSNKPFGLSQDEVVQLAIAEDDAVKQATIRPIKSLSILSPKTVLQTLEDAQKHRGWVETSVVRESGPCTTQERVFHSAPHRSVVEASTFEGRTKLLLPSLEKNLATQSESSMRQFW